MRETRTAASNFPLVHPQDLTKVDHMCHGWYSRETLEIQLGESRATSLIGLCASGSQDGYQIVSDRLFAPDNTSVAVYYIRSPLNRVFEPIRLHAAGWIELCNMFKELCVPTTGSLHYLISEPIELLLDDGFSKPIGETILYWMRLYAKVPEILSEVSLARALRVLERDSKLSGVLFQSKDDPISSESGCDQDSIPDSYTGCAPAHHTIGPFRDTAARNENGTFKRVDAQLSILYGCIRSCLPQVGIRALTHSVAVTSDVISRIVEMYLNERGFNLTIDLLNCVPTSGKYWKKATESFANKYILRLVTGIVKNGGWFSMSCDGGKRNGRNLFPVTASYYDKDQKKVVYCVVTAGFGGSTGSDAADILHYTVESMKLMARCCVENRVLDEDSPELNLALLTVDGGPDMKRTLCQALAHEDKLGYEIDVIHCFMHTHSLLLAASYTAAFGEGHKPDMEKMGVMSLLKGLSWIMSTKYPASERKKLVEVIFDISEEEMHEDTARALQELGDLDSAMSMLCESQPYVVMMTRWGTVGTALAKVCSNWSATRELLGGIAAYDSSKTVSTVAQKFHDWMGQPVLELSCHFLNTFCELWYSPWYHSLLSDKKSLVNHPDRNMVAGFRCGEMVMYCAAMELELQEVIDTFKNVISNPVAVFPIATDSDGPLSQRAPMHDFQKRWAAFTNRIPDFELQKRVMFTFLDKSKECLDQYHHQWFTKFFYTSLDSPVSRVASFTEEVINDIQNKLIVVDIQIATADNVNVAEHVSALSQTVKEKRMVHAGEESVKFWTWCPRHSLNSLFQVLETKLLAWVSGYIEGMVSPGRGRSRNSKVIWPVLERLKKQNPESWKKDVAMLVAGTQMHNQLSERNVGNAARVAYGKKSMMGATQSALVTGSTVVNHDKNRVAKEVKSSRKRKRAKSVSTTRQTTGSQRHTSSIVYSATSSELSAFVKLVDREKLSNQELEALDDYMTKFKLLRERMEPTKLREAALHEEGTKRVKSRMLEPREEIVFVSPKEIAAPSLKGHIKLVKTMKYDKVIGLLNKHFPRVPAWKKVPGGWKATVKALRSLAQKANATVVDARGTIFLNPEAIRQPVVSDETVPKRVLTDPGVPNMDDDLIDDPLVTQTSLNTFLSPSEVSAENELASQRISY